MKYTVTILSVDERGEFKEVRMAASGCKATWPCLLVHCIFPCLRSLGFVIPAYVERNVIDAALDGDYSPGADEGGGA